MIKINLLPKREHRKGAHNLDLYILAAVLVLSCVLAGGIYLRNEKALRSLRADLTTARKQKESLQSEYKEYLALEQEKKEIGVRIAAVDKIGRGRAIAPRMLYDLSSLTTENLWLKRLHKDEGKFDLEGRSMDNESICGFVEHLAKLPYMKGVELKSVEDVAEAGVTVKKFIVEGGVAS
jgi:Tfp pilus assembly protein PilN